MPENDRDEPRGKKDEGADALREQLQERMGNIEKAKKTGGGGKAAQRRPGSGGTKASEGKRSGILTRRVRIKDITVFCDEVALLLNAGMPLVPAMRTLAGRASNSGLARMANDMADRVESGASFAEAASAYTHEFGELFIGIFHAGERSGTLVDALRRVADQGDKIMQTRHKLVNALIYPFIVIVVAIGVLSFALSYMMAAFEELIVEMDMTVPWMMQTALRLGEAFRTGGFWLSVVLLIAAVIVVYFIAIQFSGFRLLRDRILIRFPFVQRFVKQSIVANFSRIFSTMLQAGVPLFDSLQAARDTTKNEVVRLAVDRTQKNVREGGRITPPLVGEKIFPPLAYDMIHVGEETGALGDVFERLADIYERKEANDLEILGQFVQPAIVTVLALVVGFIVISLFQTYAGVIGQISATM